MHAGCPRRGAQGLARRPTTARSSAASPGARRSTRCCGEQVRGPPGQRSTLSRHISGLVSTRGHSAAAVGGAYCLWKADARALDEEAQGDGCVDDLLRRIGYDKSTIEVPVAKKMARSGLA